MAVDITALRKFADTFGPAIEAIPAVIEAVAKQTDMDRALAAQAKELAKAKAEIQKAYDEADARIKVANEQVTEMLERKAAVVKEIDEMRKAADAKAKDAATKAASKLAEVEARVAASQQTLKGLDAEVAAELAAANAAHAERVKVMEAEIADLDKRRASAEKSLDTLRAKLG